MVKSGCRPPAGQPLTGRRPDSSRPEAGQPAGQIHQIRTELFERLKSFGRMERFERFERFEKFEKHASWQTDGWPAGTTTITQLLNVRVTL